MWDYQEILELFVGKDILTCNEAEIKYLRPPDHVNLSKNEVSEMQANYKWKGIINGK